MSAVRVLLVDDQELMRQGLRKLLEIEEGIEVVGEAADGVAALAVVAEVRPDVALVDARMPRMDGVELITRLTVEHPSVAAIVLSTFDEDDYIFGALRGGAAGYLLKDCSPDELVTAIRQASRGETVLSNPVAARLVADLRREPVGGGAFPGQELLSARELDVARMVAAGAANREIAARLFITEGTVKNHVSSMLRKLGLRDRTQLALRLTGR
ncbi:response regulator transcription factor [Nonomuraea glycinis]|uniref:DNA-binding response regulator n=1 Tax=Nonomuraea glycinis TaxID=2047744 RepID=A0A918A2M7_9ACTN|nr:response regulator transcription factor [Nonomuraea glycinis]MCA2175705.1 response regulator transcription factor [Nonomuraea glycinis]WSG71998.1 response regulator transcription factor [Nonomuraea glycinis]GGP05219.1 DNA-binding response regulator [Nonomuraea glycinis]